MKREGLRIEAKAAGVALGGTQILREITFSLAAGQSCAIVGRSGVGKTTLLRACAGFLPIAWGELLVGGREPADLHAVSQLGYLFQKPAMWPHLNCRDAVKLSTRLRRQSPSDGDAERTLGLVGLQAAANKFPYQLSMGMRARLAMACAMTSPLGLLLADEPFASLDPGRRLELNRLLQKLTRESGTTRLWVTHDVVEALQFSDLVLVLGGGAPATCLKAIETASLSHIEDAHALPSDCLEVKEKLLNLMEEPGDYTDGPQHDHSVGASRDAHRGVGS